MKDRVIDMLYVLFGGLMGACTFLCFFMFVCVGMRILDELYYWFD